MDHPYVTKLMVNENNYDQIMKHLESEKAHAENQLSWAEAIDVDTVRLENNLTEITDCINDIKSWKEELVL